MLAPKPEAESEFENEYMHVDHSLDIIKLIGNQV